MAVRVIDVATPGRDWDRARDSRCCMRTGSRNRMRYTLHSVPRDQRKTVQRGIKRWILHSWWSDAKTEMG